jgi:HTH-type transcriptional regulator / antitoxin HipB
MSYPIRLTEQLRPQLQALRKARGLTQAQLGELIGVKQARMAEIEANPGMVSLEQLVKLLSALGATLHLHDESDTPAPDADSW